MNNIPLNNASNQIIINITNFKSIKDLTLRCNKINVFIGKPNVGKSNILEALGLFSYAAYENDLRKFVRVDRLDNLFYKTNIENSVIIDIDKSFHLELKAQEKYYEGIFSLKLPNDKSNSGWREFARFNFDSDVKGSSSCKSNHEKYVK